MENKVSPENQIKAGQWCIKETERLQHEFIAIAAQVMRICADEAMLADIKQKAWDYYGALGALAASFKTAIEQVHIKNRPTL